MAKKPRESVTEVDGESAFLAGYDPAKYERHSVAVDVVLVAAFEGDMSTLLIQRDEHPFKGLAALPGGFLKKDETLEEAATRVLRGKANVGGVYLEQLYTFGEPRRDPRTRVISVVYYALVDEARFRAAAAGERAVRTGRIRVPWEGETGGPVKVIDEKGRALPLAFDHADIVGMAVKRLRGKLDYAPVGFQLLGETFTLLELQRVHETVLGRPVNKDSFRRRMLASGQLEATGHAQSGVDHRPAGLYRFARRSAV